MERKASQRARGGKRISTWELQYNWPDPPPGSTGLYVFRPQSTDCGGGASAKSVSPPPWPFARRPGPSAFRLDQFGEARWAIAAATMSARGAARPFGLTTN